MSDLLTSPREIVIVPDWLYRYAETNRINLVDLVDIESLRKVMSNDDLAKYLTINHPEYKQDIIRGMYRIPSCNNHKVAWANGRVTFQNPESIPNSDPFIMTDIATVKAIKDLKDPKEVNSQLKHILCGSHTRFSGFEFYVLEPFLLKSDTIGLRVKFESANLDYATRFNNLMSNVFQLSYESRDTPPVGVAVALMCSVA